MSRHPGNQISELLCSRDYQSRRRAFPRRHIRLADTRNPAKTLRRGGLRGAANLLPSAGRSHASPDAVSHANPTTSRNFQHPDSAWYRRSEEHTSELQSLMRISYAVFCLKKKNSHSHINKQITYNIDN